MKKGFLQFFAVTGLLAGAFAVFGVIDGLQSGTMGFIEAIQWVLLTAIGFPLALSIYFLPTIIAIHKNDGDGVGGMLGFNFILGWMPVFWFIMVVSACNS